MLAGKSPLPAAPHRAWTQQGSMSPSATSRHLRPTLPLLGREHGGIQPCLTPRGHLPSGLYTGSHSMHRFSLDRPSRACSIPRYIPSYCDTGCTNGNPHVGAVDEGRHPCGKGHEGGGSRKRPPCVAW